MLRQARGFVRRTKCSSRALPAGYTRQQIRNLSLHEYQAYDLLHQYNVTTPRGFLAKTVAEVESHIQSLGGRAVIKAQVLQGGRARGTFDNDLEGGVHRVRSAEDGAQLASKILGHRLQTAQTAYEGLVVKNLYVVEEITPKEQWYVAITVDRERYCPVVIISRKGGQNIEAIALESPSDILTFPLQYDQGITPDVLASIKGRLDLTSETLENLESILKSLWSIFKEKDATLLELNPLALLPSGTFVPLDAKFTFDDAASRRQAELFSLRDSEHEIAEEVEAEKYGLVYVRLDGNIGNVVNGAGLAMATNDAIGLHGGSSANFLDAGGQATKETMIQAFRIILADKRVTAILVNIYGGITKCDMIAKSIIGAASELGPMSIPIVARLQGTNSAEGLKLLEEANLGIHVEAGFGEAAKKTVEVAGAYRP